MDAQTTQEPRTTADRRQKPTAFWDVLRPGGRRVGFRRSDEERRSHFVDHFGLTALTLVMSLLALSIFDGVITLCLLEAGCQEINPLMAYLLEQGSVCFLLGKYLLTAASILTFLLFKNFYLFGTTFRVGYLVPVVVAGYTVLLLYQLYLVYCLLGG